MALVLEANYSKKLGLPGYSSHQYSVTVRAELADVSQVDSESKRLYALLQSCVDRELQSTGFLPGQQRPPANGNGAQQTNGGNGHGSAEEWKCSAKQKELILKIVEEQNLNKAEVEHLSFKLFGIGVRSLNKLQASSLISELSAQSPASSRGRRPQRMEGPAGGRP
jgi:hypothetical protein